jgi:hypothetical protein
MCATDDVGALVERAVRAACYALHLSESAVNSRAIMEIVDLVADYQALVCVPNDPRPVLGKYTEYRKRVADTIVRWVEGSYREVFRRPPHPAAEAVRPVLYDAQLVVVVECTRKRYPCTVKSTCTIGTLLTQLYPRIFPGGTHRYRTAAGDVQRPVGYEAYMENVGIRVRTERRVRPRSRTIRTFAPVTEVSLVMTNALLDAILLDECAVCLEEVGHQWSFGHPACAHCVCQPCMRAVLAQERARCPLCRREWAEADRQRALAELAKPPAEAYPLYDDKEEEEEEA